MALMIGARRPGSGLGPGVSSARGASDAPEIGVVPMAGSWRDDGLVAWTERDGPGQPPRGPQRWLSMGISTAFLGIFASMIFSDTLCPEHRAWVMLLGSIGLASTVVAGVGLWRSWAIAAPLSVLAAGSGVVIGLIDSIHSASRGRSIAGAFAVLLVGAVALTWRQIVLLRWDRKVRRSLAASDVVDLEALAAPVTPGAPVASVDGADAVADDEPVSEPAAVETRRMRTPT
jgi:hypothetical protein